VGSPEGGSHKGGNMRAFPTGGEHTSTGNLQVCFQKNLKKTSSFPFLHSLLLVFFYFRDLSLSYLCFLIFLIHLIKKSFHGNMGTYKYRGIFPKSLGIFCWRRSLKIQREIRREVFSYIYIYIYITKMVH